MDNVPFDRDDAEINGSILRMTRYSKWCDYVWIANVALLLLGIALWIPCW